VHLPDAVFEVDGERHAIEVELTLKSRDRLAQTIAEHSLRYDAVVYFGTGATVPRVEEAVTAGGYENVFAREVPGPRSWSGERRSFGCWADESRVRVVSDRSVGRSGELRRLLCLLAEQGPVSVDHLGRFLDRERDDLQDLLDEVVAERLVREAAVVEGEPAWVWPTRRGMNRCGSDLHPPIPRVGGARLMRATNEARLYIESRSPRAVWVSRRRLLRVHGSRTSQPRGVVEMGSERHAVCVELVQLPSGALFDRYAGRCEAYDAVVVFCAGTVGERLEGLAERWGWRNLRVVDLPGTVRRRRGGRRPDRERLSLEEIERRVLARLEGEAPEDPGGFVAVFGDEVRGRLEAARSAPAESMGIEELAEAVGITASTIRVYQQLGMVRPPRVGGGSGCYDAEHRETLELIADLRSRRVSRAVVRELLMGCRGVVEVRGDERLTRDELCERVVVSPWAVSWLIREGALQAPSVRDGSECFEADHLRRLLAVQEMRAAGYKVEEVVSYFSG
jgi:DNA-binding transcriptional MerR regulator